MRANGNSRRQIICLSYAVKIVLCLHSLQGMGEVQWWLCLRARKIYVAQSWTSGKMAVVSVSWVGCSGLCRYGGCCGRTVGRRRANKGRASVSTFLSVQYDCVYIPDSSKQTIRNKLIIINSFLFIQLQSPRDNDG